MTPNSAPGPGYCGRTRPPEQEPAVGERRAVRPTWVSNANACRAYAPTLATESSHAPIHAPARRPRLARRGAAARGRPARPRDPLGLQDPRPPGRAEFRDPQSRRRLHSRPAPEGGVEAVAGSGPGHALPPAVPRPDRAAADAEGGGRVRRRPAAGRLRAAGREAAGEPALRRAVGPPLA